jgi:hypothetical protein
VQGPVDLPIPGPRQTVSNMVTGGRVNGGGAVPGGEVALVGEASDVAELDEQSGGPGRSDAGQVQQGGAGGQMASGPEVRYVVRLWDLAGAAS